MKDGKKTLQQQAYEVIKERIITCSYTPGTLLNTLDLQTCYGISRTPIREALGRLEQEHLVRVVPKKGFMVCAFSLDTIKALFETRLLIEPHIVAVYGQNIDEAQLKRLRAIFCESLDKDKERFFLYDIELHALIGASCPNMYLRQALSRIADQTRRLRIVSEQTYDRIPASCEEHVAIIDAILAGKGAEAAAVMRTHLNASLQVAFALPKAFGATE